VYAPRADGTCGTAQFEQVRFGQDMALSCRMDMTAAALKT
jgi:hypothetical protein